MALQFSHDPFTLIAAILSRSINHFSTTSEKLEFLTNFHKMMIRKDYKNNIRANEGKEEIVNNYLRYLFTNIRVYTDIYH